MTLGAFGALMSVTAENHLAALLKLHRLARTDCKCRCREHKYYRYRDHYGKNLFHSMFTSFHRGINLIVNHNFKPHCDTAHQKKQRGAIQKNLMELSIVMKKESFANFFAALCEC
jgi:hypothetical protein